MEPFSDPGAVAGYADGPPRVVPGFASLQRMAMLLIAERAPETARVLVLGAGGGLEIAAFAEARAGWTFDGVDPSRLMLDLAASALAPFGDRSRLHHGLIDVAPEGPFDAATALLTLHFVAREERLRTLREIRRRLKPGAPLVVAHFSFSQVPGERERWLARYAAFASASGVDPAKAEAARAAIASGLPILSPEEDERQLAEAGFGDAALFYLGFTFRGWVAYA